MREASRRVVSAVTSSAKHRPPIFSDPELLKPLVFPNHERKFKLFSYAVCGVITFYGIFFVDFGKQEHCFSGIRRYASKHLESFLTIRPEDEKHVQERVDRMKARIEEMKGTLEQYKQTEESKS